MRSLLKLALMSKIGIDNVSDDAFYYFLSHVTRILNTILQIFRMRSDIFVNKETLPSFSFSWTTVLMGKTRFLD